jgi:hypothetical protein
MSRALFFCLATLMLACSGRHATCGGTVAPPRASEEPAYPLTGGENDRGGFDSTRERIGPLRLGLSGAEALATLGEPESRGPAEENAATGLFHQLWEYSGITLELTSETVGGSLTVAGITITAPCGFRTDRGIGIGSSAEDVRRTYGAFRDQDSPIEPDRLVAGSVYGGMIFYFESERLIRIFVGAAAE